MMELKGNRVLANIIFKVLSILTALSLCIIPVIGSQPAQAAPPPGSTAAATFTSSTPPPAAATTTTTTTTTETETETTVETDKFKYYPDETAAINGGGYTPGATVEITLTGPDGSTTTWATLADEAGNISTTYNLGASTEGAYTIQLTDGTNSATTMFTDPTTSAYLYPTSNSATNLTRYYQIGYRPNPNQNWNYVDEAYSTSGSPATGNDGDRTVVYTNITGDHYGNNTPVSDVYNMSNLPGGYQLYTTSGSLQTPTPTSDSNHQTGTWSNDNTIVMQWNSVPSGTVTSNPTVTVTTVCRENGIGADGLVQILLVQPTGGSGQTTYTYTPTQGSNLTGSWAVYSVTLNNAPNGETWSTSNINSLKAGVSLSQLGSLLGWAGMTQLYVEVAPGVMSPVLANYNYHWDSASNTSTTGTTTSQVTLSDGSHIFYVNAQDTNGNTTPYGTSGAYLIDTRGPAVTTNIDGSTTHGWYNKAAVGSDNQLGVTVNANDTNGTTPVSGVNYIVYQIGSNPSNTVTNTSTAGATGNGKSATQSTTYVISTLGNINQGATTLTNSATDVANNTTSTTQTVLIDTVGPSVSNSYSGTVGNNNWYKSNVTATASASDATSGVDTVTSTLNGSSTTSSNPTTVDSNHKSVSYSTATTISNQGMNTFSSSATDYAGNTASTVTDTIKIDSAGPAVSHAVTSGTTGNYGWYKSNINVNTNATDGTSGVDSITNNLNGSSSTTTNPTWTDTTNFVKSSPYSTSTSITTEGVNTLASSAQDVAGNTSGTVTDTYRIDTSAPTVSGSLSGTTGNNGWYTAKSVTATYTGVDTVSGVETVQITANMADGGSASSTVTNLSWADATNFIKNSTLTYNMGVSYAEGINTVSATATDAAGNTGYSTTSTVKVDSAGPTIAHTNITGTAGNNGWYKSAVNVTSTATDATSGVDAIQDNLNGTTTTTINTNVVDATNVIKSGTFTTNTNITGEGLNTLASSSTDVAGNNSGTATSTILIDTQAPTTQNNLSGTTGNYGWYTSSTVGMQISASDPTPGSGVDTVNFSLTNGGASLSGTLTNTDTTGAIANGKSSTYTSPVNNLLTQGVTTLATSASDVAGNTSGTTTTTIKHDSAGPALTTNLTGTTGENGWYTSTVGVDLNASDATSGVDSIRYSLNGGGTTTATNGTWVDTTNNIKSSPYSTSTTVTTEGVNTLTSSASDVAGNSSGTNTDTIKIDTVAPTLVKTINGAAPIDSTTHNGWYNAADLSSGGGTLNIALTSTDATSGVQNITYSVNGASTTSNGGGANTYTANLALDSTNQGTNTLTHSAKDMAGNAYVLTTQTVKLDSIIPTLVSSVARTGLDQVTVTLTGADALSGSGIDNIAYSTDGSTQVTVIGTGYDQTVTYIVTGYGSHALAQSIADIAGNQAGQNSSVAIGQSSTASATPNTPVPTLTFSLQNGTMNSVPVTPSGMLLSDADLNSPDGLLTLNIPAGTTVRNSDGSPTYMNQDPDIISIATANGNAPEGYQMISSYDLTPNGITFDSPITMGINYGNNLPNGKQPVIAFYDETAGKWVDLETAGYIAADGSEVSNTAAARVSHFTRFALLAK